MRIDKLWIKDFRNLRNFRIDFDERYLETVLIGQNASGKSNLIEVIILIFRNLDLEIPSEIEYRISYAIRGKVVIVNASDAGYHFMVDDKEITKAAFWRSKNELLPKYVFAYYSGLSNRLETHFDRHQNRFYKEIIKQGIIRKDIDDLRRLFYVRLIHSYFVLLAFFSFEETEQQATSFLKEVLGIEDLVSVLFVLHKPNWKGKVDERFWGAGGLVSEFLGKLWELALAPIYDEISVPLDFRRNTSKEVLYLFLSSKEKLQKLSRNYGSNTEFFKAIESTYISDLIEEVRVKVKKRHVDGSLRFKELSEGEQQLLTVIGMLMFAKDEESLVLLDEPDTHLNPIWKWRYLEFLKQVISNKDGTQIILNTHDPLVIGGLVKEQVRIFENVEGSVFVNEPSIDPKGLGVAGILTSDLFGMPTTLDRETQEKLNERNRLMAIQNSRSLDSSEQKQLELIFEELKGLGFTQSFRDPLYQRFIKAQTLLESPSLERFSKTDLETANANALEILEELLKEEENEIH